MRATEVCKKREVLWDMELAESSRGVLLRMHEPVRRGGVLECNEPWEGEHCGYGKIIYDGEKYRFYYRGCGCNAGVWKRESGEHAVWCVAYSFDGKHFFKPDLGIFEYNGNKHNNIIMKTENNYVDNFSIFLDTNPNCPDDAKYKAISGHTYNWEKRDIALKLYKSADGIHFEYVGEMLRGLGMFDSMNTIFWEDDKSRYCLYIRDYHELDEANSLEYEKEKHVRDVRVCFSEDFVNWTAPTRLDYGEDKTEFQLYTNGVMRYGRADIYIGIPTRYIDRTPDEVNYKYLPDINGYRQYIIEKAGRCGTAMTDCFLMVSRDGVRFTRTKEAFLSPGVENGDNWAYGDCYFAYGVIETASDFCGEPNELSLYVGKGYRARPVTFERYTLRLDGFFSWRADFEGGEVISKPITVDGDSLSVNFATSAVGYLRIELLDENGVAIEGYDSSRLFGNSVSRPIDFAKPLSELCGKTVRMKISMRDCDFYSFAFK